jgi:hypothetical protein
MYIRTALKETANLCFGDCACPNYQAPPAFEFQENRKQAHLGNLTYEMPK